MAHCIRACWRMYADARHFALIAVWATLFGSVLFSLPAPSTSAAFNPEINYQGKLTDDLGATVANGVYDMRFQLYTQAVGGSPIWTEDSSTTVQNGLFSVMLGSSTPLTGVDFNQTLYLGVRIEADLEMTPRKILGAVPAAFEAENAQTFAGIATTSFLRSDQVDTASALLTFSGGLVSQSSSTILSLTTITATTTYLVINGERFTDLTGGGLMMSGGALTANISESNLNIAGSPTDGYILLASSTAAGGFVWAATSSLNISSGTNLTFGTDNQIPYMNAGGDDFDYSSSFTFSGSALTVGADILPATTLIYDLGSASNRFANLWAETLNVGTSTWSIFNGSNGRLAFSNAAEQGGSELFSILNNGNVGIGTPSPNSILAVTDTSDNDRQILFEGRNDLSGFQLRAPGDNLFLSTGDNRSDTPLVALRTSGRVGIGTNDPQNPLHVYTSESDAYLASFESGGGYAGISFSNDGVNYPFFGTAGSGGLYTWQPAGGGFTIYSGGTVLFDAKGNGNVGIGTATPGHKLEIAGYANFNAANKLAIGDVAGYQGLIYMESATETLTIENTSDYSAGAIIFRHNGDERMRIASTGNVGIGTDSPDYKLDISGDARIDGDLYDAFGSAGSVGMVLQSTASGIKWVSTSSLNIAADTGVSDYETFTAGGTWTKPAGVLADQLIIVEMWGGGGSGESGGNQQGGGGGAYHRLVLRASELASSVSVTVGSGGTAGNGGGVSSFGSYGSAYGGNRGTSAGGGGGGGILSTGVSGGGAGGSPVGTAYGGGRGYNTGEDSYAEGSVYGGGGGGGSGHSTRSGGSSVYGGGGGCGSTCSAGTSVYGGNGGTQGNAGTIPGGGGGGSAVGARGEVRVWVIAAGSGGADVAENYPVVNTAIEPGDIVSFDTKNPIVVDYATEDSDKPLAGIISTQPGLILDDFAWGDVVRPVALSGRVPTKVNLEGGPILPGDRIAPSSVPGMGRKAKLFEPSVGTALTPFTGADGVAHGFVTVFIDLQPGLNTDALSDVLFGASSLTPTASSTLAIFEPLHATDTIWKRLYILATNFVDGILSLVGLRAEIGTFDQLCVGDVCVDETTFLQMIETSGAQPAGPLMPADDKNDDVAEPPEIPTEPEPALETEDEIPIAQEGGAAGTTTLMTEPEAEIVPELPLETTVTEEIEPHDMPAEGTLSPPEDEIPLAA